MSTTTLSPETAAGLQLVTFRLSGVDLALPLRSVATIQKSRGLDAGSASGADSTDRVRDLVAGPGSRRQPATVLEVRTRSGPVSFRADEIVEVTQSVVDRGADLPAWAMGRTHIGRREVVVIEPDRLCG